MKSFFALLVCLLMGWQQVVAQEFSNELWHDGYIVTNEMDTLIGQLKYDLERDLVQLDTDGRIQAYSSKRIVGFHFEDQATRQVRSFYSIPYTINPGYQVPRFFEVLYLGKLSLLTREKVQVKSVSPTSMNLYGSRTEVSYDLFFIDSDRQITNFTGRKNQILAVMSDHSKQISTYLKKNNIRTDNIKDILELTAYYNGLQ